ncbi:hypothetical protein B0H13DRAFT_2402003 [Mycena leptocephala]|nr:hypothetical protein B0H13DRAFT_2402003 [Mycena leptocephala]
MKDNRGAQFAISLRALTHSPLSKPSSGHTVNDGGARRRYASPSSRLYFFSRDVLTSRLQGSTDTARERCARACPTVRRKEKRMGKRMHLARATPSTPPSESCTPRESKADPLTPALYTHWPHASIQRTKHIFELHKTSNPPDLLAIAPLPPLRPLRMLLSKVGWIHRILDNTSRSTPPPIYSCAPKHPCYVFIAPAGALNFIYPQIDLRAFMIFGH